MIDNINRDSLKSKDWDSLSIKEKSEMMRVAISNGITTIPEIKETYNSFAMGGPEKVGPTYDPETKKWTNYKGQDITGKSFKGEYGTTTYLDSGAVDLDTSDGSSNIKSYHKWRYASNAPRVYIGGTTNEARQKYFDSDAELTNTVKQMAKQYGISPNVLASRIAKEGPIDENIRHYNTTNGYYGRGFMCGPIWGLDDLGTMISDGTIKLKNDLQLETDYEMINEKGRTTYSVASDNFLDGVEITAAALQYYKGEMKKRFPNATNEQLEQYATAAFNAGLTGATNMINNGQIGNAYKPFINIKKEGGQLFGGGGELSERERALQRANYVASDYEDAKDFAMNPIIYAVRKAAKDLTDKGGLSNCTLTATQWVDPNNPYMSARNIHNHPSSGYYEIDAQNAIPGDLLITRNPDNGSYHTMMIEGFDENNKPLLRYSKGGHSEDNLVINRPLDQYHQLDNSQGGNHTEEYYFRYNYPDEVFLPEVEVTAQKANGGNLFGGGGDTTRPIYKTEDGYIDDEGNPVEQIGWDSNGNAQFRTVRGTIGRSYEPMDAATIVEEDPYKRELRKQLDFQTRSSDAYGPLQMKDIFDDVRSTEEKRFAHSEIYDGQVYPGHGALKQVSPEFDLLMMGRMMMPSSKIGSEVTTITKKDVPTLSTDFSSPSRNFKDIFSDMERISYNSLMSSGKEFDDSKYSLISSLDRGYKKSTPQLSINVIQNSTVPRMAEMRPLMTREEVENLIMPEVTKGYTEYPASTFRKAGYDEFTQGAHYPSTGTIVVKKDGSLGINKIMTHEPRHGIQQALVRTEEENNLLNNSFEDLQIAFDTSGKEYLIGYNADAEFETLNLDARNELLGFNKASKFPVEHQNKIIDAASDEEIIDAMSDADGYGQVLVNYYERTLGKVPTEKVKAWRQSMKKVGAIATPAVVTTSILTSTGK